VVINPGNPTGQVMHRHNLEQIIKLCHKHSILIMADEVYQQNVYTKERQFVSMRKVLHDMGGEYCDQVEMISFNSISKGVLGECGLRGGYYEIHNFSSAAQDIVYKLKSVELCGNTVGQMGNELMANPPRRGRESDACVDLYESQVNIIRSALEDKAKILT
jgi:aspartate/methionine/tyrosine aminotransferase